MNNAVDSKTKNSSRNMVFGFILKFYRLLMPFIIRTIVIYTLGREYAGLNSLFSSLISVLSIAELGVGTIMVFYMYKPIEEDDTDTICALMLLYKIYYRVIGVVVLLIGLAISPFLQYLIRGDIPAGINIYTLYYINLATAVSSYWMFAYKNSLFQAHQRNDVISKISIFTDTVKYVLQIFLLCILKNYYFFVIAILATQIMDNLLVAIKATKTYPHYKAKGTLEKRKIKEINTSIKDIFFSQLGLVITLSVDSIVISAFLGLISLAMYENYYYVVNALFGFFTIFYQSLRASIGTNIIVKGKEDNYLDFKFITFVVMGAITLCSACLINLFQPFIEIWVGKENLLDNMFVFLLVFYFVVYETNILIDSYKGISGKWHDDRFRPLITALVNLVTNVIFVQTIGIYGILLSTIISLLFVNFPWLFKRLFIDVFEKDNKRDYFFYLVNKLLELFIITITTYFICGLICFDSLFVQIGVKLLICILMVLLMYCLFNKKDSSLKKSLEIVNRIFCKI